MICYLFVCELKFIEIFISLHNKINSMSKISKVGHDEIRKHQANNSPAKVSFRFSSTKRFKDNNPECPVAFYSYGSQLSNRKTMLGYGKKSDYTTDLAKAPSSALYNPGSYNEFVKNKGLSFGLSREQSPDQSYLVPQIHKHPGVGAVFLLLFSINSKNKVNVTLHIPSVPKLLTLLIKI